MGWLIADPIVTEYNKFYRTVSVVPVGDKYMVYYESGNNFKDLRMNQSFATKEEAKAAIDKLDQEIKEAT